MTNSNLKFIFLLTMTFMPTRNGIFFQLLYLRLRVLKINQNKLYESLVEQIIEVVIQLDFFTFYHFITIF